MWSENVSLHIELFGAPIAGAPYRLQVRAAGHLNSRVLRLGHSNPLAGESGGPREPTRFAFGALEPACR
eukprot:2958144-Prymnesium_polylepis.1